MAEHHIITCDRCDDSKEIFTEEDRKGWRQIKYRKSKTQHCYMFCVSCYKIYTEQFYAFMEAFVEEEITAVEIDLKEFGRKDEYTPGR